MMPIAAGLGSEVMLSTEATCDLQAKEDESQDGRGSIMQKELIADAKCG